MIEGHDYTIYSKGPGGRSRMYALLALITAFLTPLAQHGILTILRRTWGDDWEIAETALFFGGFTALILFGILINQFNQYIWRTGVGQFLFRMAGMPAPPNLAGEYAGEIDVRAAADPTNVYRTDYRMRIAQTWEQIMLLVERKSESGALVRVHSDMASVQVGMLNQIVTLRFLYTFEENVTRENGSGLMTRQFTGAAIFQFTHETGRWIVEGHFFDDIGRSGKIELRQTVADGLADAAT